MLLKSFDRNQLVSHSNDPGQIKIRSLPCDQEKTPKIGISLAPLSASALTNALSRFVQHTGKLAGRKHVPKILEMATNYKSRHGQRTTGSMKKKFSPI